jgi:flagellar motor protein MotB
LGKNTEMDEENILDFNFWPSFSDLMLSLVLILVLVLFLVSAVLNVGTVNLSHVEKNQKEMIDSIGYAFGVTPKKVEDEENVFIIPTASKEGGDIFVKNEPTLQRITFSSNILFPPDEIELNDRGREALRRVGRILQRNLPIIREIQIQGHADTTPSRKYQSNIHLAAMRAISVFKFLQDELQIDPAENLMSTTSFGEYKPVQRSEDEKQYNQSFLNYHNGNLELRERNRRIELLIFYRYQQK